MKFAKELEDDAVPEWRIKYLNYKAGKKYITAVSRAINRANGTPLGLGKKGDLPPRTNAGYLTSPFMSRNQNDDEENEEGDPLAGSPAPMGSTKSKAGGAPHSGPAALSPRTENQSLTRSPGNLGHYGSFISTPRGQTPSSSAGNRNPFELPAPALEASSGGSVHDPINRLRAQRSASMAPVNSGGNAPGGFSRPMHSATFDQSSPSRFQRIFSVGQPLNRSESSKLDIKLHAFDQVRQREKEFFAFLDSELEKVETFYKQKEEQAGQRLNVLREQLHEMRNRRTEEVEESKRRKEEAAENGDHENGEGEGHHMFTNPFHNKLFKPGSNSKALSNMPRTPVMPNNADPANRDYVRRPNTQDVPYRTAKRKLKLALQEFYRGLELLKSYALLNRTAFRKLNKKYDKTVNAKPPYRYLNEKVNKSWFVNSDIIDGHIRTVEDLYARYFEKGNHKIAAGKLRHLTRKAGDESGSAFRNGVLIGTGAVFAVQGLIYGAELLFNPDPVLAQQTSYLMQIYGGYFLMLMLFGLFCMDCYLWNNNKVNYPFIFEFDPRHHLDWRQLAQFFAFFFLMFGVIFWVNFSRLGAPVMYLYYPVILIGLSVAMILLPLPILGHRSRKWFAYAHYRLFFAGLYPVEFRDFFLGDIWCSLTYATSNIELFFCIYANGWNNPPQCNSSHSRLLGFFSALPPVWRALQCIRRYRDTKNVFPHLVNCGKYMMTIMAAICLSLYRLDGTHSNLALFITFSTVNSIYCSIWDLFMDFSLMQPHSRHAFLRDILAFKRRWLYYVIVFIDPVLRFGWIMYAIFTYDAQHSTIVSFLVAFAEVIRRGCWTLLRVENEHCANVAQYKASRDVPLPYQFEHEPLTTRESLDPGRRPGDTAGSSSSTSPEVGPGGSPAQTQPQAGASPGVVAPSTPEEGGLRRRKFTAGPIKGIVKLLAEAHKQDFEKKRRAPERPIEEDEIAPGDDMASDEELEDDSDVEDRMDMQHAESLIRGHDKHDDVGEE